MAEHEMTVAQVRDWLRKWVADATGQDVASINDDSALESYGLSSRDAVTLSGELEELLGRTLDATVAYKYPSISTLAEYLVEGPGAEDTAAPVAASISVGVTGAPEDREIAIVGIAARFPGGANDPQSMWDLLAAGEDGRAVRRPARRRGAQRPEDDVDPAEPVVGQVAGQAAERLRRRGPEGGAQGEVLDRVARQHHLGQEDHPRAVGGRLGDGGAHQGGVAGQVSRTRVHLGDRERERHADQRSRAPTSRS